MALHSGAARHFDLSVSLASKAAWRTECFRNWSYSEDQSTLPFDMQLPGSSLQAKLRVNGLTTTFSGFCFHLPEPGAHTTDFHSILSFAVVL